MVNEIGQFDPHAENLLDPFPIGLASVREFLNSISPSAYGRGGAAYAILYPRCGYDCSLASPHRPVTAGERTRAGSDLKDKWPRTNARATAEWESRHGRPCKRANRNSGMTRQILELIYGPEIGQRSYDFACAYCNEINCLS